MEITRHARNRMRRENVMVDEAPALVTAEPRDADDRGNLRWTGLVRGNGYRVALSPDRQVLISSHPRRKS